MLCSKIEMAKESHMYQTKTHDNCKFFSFQACPHKNDEIMKKATQDIPQYSGGKYQTMSFPRNEEIDAICSKCDKFTQK